ncbi:UNVERIFIED_CONTAM: hypothetical protein Slati_2706700 [Sesamum latifolium]|uniref:Endonuclease/exonuclease/phosphatase domain-containing protein n=1 Tax=Sesamum latifolium TaxID=2727402 RepID=A0AAW2VXL0_9LAMI
MKILSWNCQGLGSSWTVRNLVELVKLHNPGLVFLFETKSKYRRYDRLKECLNYHGMGVESQGRSGGLLMLWCKDVEVWIQSYCSHHIDASVKGDVDEDRWRITGIYGHPEVSKCKETWQLLRYLSKLSIRPWMCVGDFNEIRLQHAPWLGLN